MHDTHKDTFTQACFRYYNLSNRCFRMHDQSFSSWEGTDSETTSSIVMPMLVLIHSSILFFSIPCNYVFFGEETNIPRLDPDDELTWVGNEGRVHFLVSVYSVVMTVWWWRPSVRNVSTSTEFYTVLATRSHSTFVHNVFWWRLNETNNFLV